MSTDDALIANSFQEEFQMLKDVALGAMSVFLSLLAILATANLLPRDLEDLGAVKVRVPGGDTVYAIPEYEPQRLAPEDQLRGLMANSSDEEIDNQTASRLKRQLAQEFRQQLQRRDAEVLGVGLFHAAGDIHQHADFRRRGRAGRLNSPCAFSIFRHHHLLCGAAR